MRRKRVYLETSVISYAASRRTSGVLMVAAQQQYTQMWLEKGGKVFDLYCSEVVAAEANQGDAEAISRRLELVRSYPSLRLDLEASELGELLVRRHALPAKARTDALHVAIAAVNAMDFLATWNCTHINNAMMKPKIERCCSEMGYACPVICSLMELVVSHD